MALDATTSINKKKICQRNDEKTYRRPMKPVVDVSPSKRQLPRQKGEGGRRGGWPSGWGSNPP